MASNPIKLSVRKNDTFIKAITLTFSETGDPIDLTNSIITGTIKKLVEDTAIFDNFQILNRDDVNGKFDLVLTPTQTALFLVDGYSDSYYFELSINFGGSPEYVKTYMYGTLIVGQ